MKNTLIIVALLMTLITVSAKAWRPCNNPNGPNWTCPIWTEELVTKTITVTVNPLCTATITYELFSRVCTDEFGNVSTEFFITSLNYFNQPCLDNYLNQDGYFHADRYSDLMNNIAKIQSNEFANDFFNDPDNRLAYACNPNCVNGQTVFMVGYSFPYCYGICKAVEAGITYLKHTTCSVNHCCSHTNKYCWNNGVLQLCEGIDQEYGFGDCDSYIPECNPEIGPYPETLVWVPQTIHCVYHCNQ